MATLLDERVPPPDNTTNDDPALSIWAPSESQLNQDLEAAREDTLARLITRVEQIERRLDSHGDGSLNAGIEKAILGDGEEWSWGGWKVSNIIWAVIGICLLIWACAMVTLWVAAKYRAAGFPQPGSAGSVGYAGNAGDAGKVGGAERM